MAAGRVEESRPEEATGLDPHRGTVSLSLLGQVWASWWERGAAWCKAGRVASVALPRGLLLTPGPQYPGWPLGALTKTETTSGDTWGRGNTLAPSVSSPGYLPQRPWTAVRDSPPRRAPTLQGCPRGVMSGDARPLSAQTPCAALLWLGALVSVCILIQMLCYL